MEQGLLRGETPISSKRPQVVTNYLEKRERSEKRRASQIAHNSLHCYVPQNYNRCEATNC